MEQNPFLVNFFINTEDFSSRPQTITNITLKCVIKFGNPCFANWWCFLISALWASNFEVRWGIPNTRTQDLFSFTPILPFSLLSYFHVQIPLLLIQQVALRADSTCNYLILRITLFITYDEVSSYLKETCLAPACQPSLLRVPRQAAHSQPTGHTNLLAQIQKHFDVSYLNSAKRRYIEIPISSSSQTQVAMNVCTNMTFKICEFGFFLGGRFCSHHANLSRLLRRKIDASKLTSGKLSLSLSLNCTNLRKSSDERFILTATT